MTPPSSNPPLDWSCEQISVYRDLLPRYNKYANAIQQVLDQVVNRLAPLAIVQTRPKSVASFAEKIQRKWPAITDPINQFTDLCGGRVITYTLPEVKAVCEFLKGHFEIDWENSIDVSQRLKPAEFGYRSVHYIVMFKHGEFPNQDVPVEIPEDVYGLKAEIQVRTLLEHAWAGFSHDRVYKSTYVIPKKWERELAGVAALLEQADEAFYHIEQGLQSYAANYGAYRSEVELRSEMELLENVLACDPDNPDLMYRIGKLAMILEEWKKAVEIFEKHKDLTYQPILRDLGVSLCKLYKVDPKNPEYLRGQKYLQKACNLPKPDADALGSLAGTYKETNPQKALELYRKAFEVEPTYPYAVSNYLIAEIADKRDISIVSLMKPAIKLTVQRCRDQISVGMNLPWAYYDLGTFELVMNHPYQSLSAYAKAIQLSPADWYLETTLKTLRQLKDVKEDLAGYEWAIRFMCIALAGKFNLGGYRSLMADAASPGALPVTEPVVILAGNCDASLEKQMKAYYPLLLESFKGFRGTLISGGTRAGIAGLVGDLQASYPESIYTIGHIPALIPPNITADRRYRELRKTIGHDFNALGPLQIWADIITSGIKPECAKLIGIGGGTIAAVEYRMALALGAQVAIIEGSGRSAGQLLADDEWNGLENLTRMPADVAGLRSILGVREENA